MTDTTGAADITAGHLHHSQPVQPVHPPLQTACILRAYALRGPHQATLSGSPYLHRHGPIRHMCATSPAHTHTHTPA
jgi:hypothetical protein